MNQTKLYQILQKIMVQLGTIQITSSLFFGGSIIMCQSQSSLQLNEFLQKEAFEVQNWLVAIKSGCLNPPAEFNWLGLAEAAAFKAHSKSDLLWAEVAIQVYQRLADETNSSAQGSLIISLMLLKAAMIAIFGSVLGHPVLDIEPIIQWFNDSMMTSFDEVAKKTAIWRDCTIEEIRDLRAIKNRLKVISILANSQKCILPKELEVWLSLREQLP